MKRATQRAIKRAIRNRMYELCGEPMVDLTGLTELRVVTARQEDMDRLAEKMFKVRSKMREQGLLGRKKR